MTGISVAAPAKIPSQKFNQPLSGLEKSSHPSFSHSHISCDELCHLIKNGQVPNLPEVIQKAGECILVNKLIMKEHFEISHRNSPMDKAIRTRAGFEEINPEERSTRCEAIAHDQLLVQIAKRALFKELRI